LVYDNTKPSDDVELKDISLQTRPNFQAIQSGDPSFSQDQINISNRTTLPDDNDPETPVGMSRVYAKEDGEGNIELFTRDTQGNIVQLTEGGRIGSRNTVLSCSNISFPSLTTETFSPKNLMIAAIRWQANGQTISSFGCTILRTGTGIYLITLSETPQGPLYPCPTPIAESLRSHEIRLTNPNQFEVRFRSSNGSFADSAGVCNIFGGYN